jgi:uncharacterized protein YecE (DUF72 family)
MPTPYVGTAGWSIPRAAHDRFPGRGTHLQRYGHGLSCVEINSSFYRPHRRDTYARWAESTPTHFRFAVKMPRVITHERQLRGARDQVNRFLDETSGLGPKCGPLLIQLPPSHVFDARVTARFLEMLRARHHGPVVWEPRHATWFDGRADRLLAGFSVARAAADPPPAVGADRAGGWDGLVYYRLHGSPRMYWSRYDAAFIDATSRAILNLPPSTEVWCIFDNTAAGAAIDNACELRARLTTVRSG